MHDAAKLLGPRSEPCEFLFTDFVVLGITGLCVRFLQLLEHGSLTMRPLRPDTEEAAVYAFGEGSQKGDIVIVRRVVRQCEKDALIEAFRRLMKQESGVFAVAPALRL